MTYSEFLDKPWAKQHSTYEDSVFSMRPAPEFATAEVILASLYRAIGFKNCSESAASGNGRKLEKFTLSSAHGTISNDTWNSVLKTIVDSPKQPKQSSKRFLSLSPLVPQTGLYSGSARLQGNPWNPGALLQQIIRNGSLNDNQANELWNELFHALSVSENDDVWAMWLGKEFDRRPAAGHSWEATMLDTTLPILPEDDRSNIKNPAKIFTQDLRAIISAKKSMTRRQWVSLLEAVLRLGVVSHCLWICSINDRIWRAIEAILIGESPDGANNEDIKPYHFNIDGNLLTYGNNALPHITNITSSYCSARLGINLILWELEGRAPECINSSDAANKLINIVKENKEYLIEKNVLKSFWSLRDKESRTISCKKNIGSNIVEFCRYTLGQRQTLDELLRGYDQGYFLKKRNESKRSPWIVGLGPVAILAMTHCALHKAAGPRSIQQLINHMKWYGMEIRIDHIVSGDIGMTLRQLGLVLDSPDAESGMLLEKPFIHAKTGISA
jgi:hypothetical protein